MSAIGLDGISRQVEQLSARVKQLEDELAIHRLIVSYGFAVDTGDAAATAELFTEETLYDVDATMIMHGRAGIRDMVLGPTHQALLPDCAHTIGPAVVEVEGDRATATAYSRVYRRRRGDLEGADEFYLWRLSCNRFELERRGGEWQIARRTTRLLGNPEAQPILSRGLPAAD